MMCSGAKPCATLRSQAARQSRLNRSEDTGLMDMAHSRSKAFGNSPFRYATKSSPPFSFPLSPSGGQEGGLFIEIRFFIG